MRFRFVQIKSMNRNGMFSQKFFDCFNRTISDTNLNKLRRMPEKQTALLKIRILRHNCKIVLLCIIPNFRIGRITHTDVSDMSAVRKNIC